MNAAQAKVIAIYLLRVGYTIRDVSDRLRCHPRAVLALIAT